jgi:hypothetical protein
MKGRNIQIKFTKHSKTNICRGKIKAVLITEVQRIQVRYLIFEYESLYVLRLLLTFYYYKS